MLHKPLSHPLPCYSLPAYRLPDQDGALASAPGTSGATLSGHPAGMRLAQRSAMQSKLQHLRQQVIPGFAAFVV